VTERLTSIFVLAGAVFLASYLNAPAELRPAPTPVTFAELAGIQENAPLAAEVAQETERLRARLATVPDMPAARRDPFSFGTSRRPAPSAAAGNEESAPVEGVAAVDEVVAPAIAWPTLVAVLTARGSETALSAALGIGDGVEIALAGETHAGFLVRAITETAVELVHVATATTTRLSIRSPHI
jgi:hypothetical protein